jgi:hypothetical protein
VTAGTAVFSPCRRWRYALTREVGGDAGTVVFVCLNPSTADELHDDPTTRRCAGFARRWGYGRVELVNLYGLRATRSAELRAAADPVGPGNADAVRAAVARADLVVCAWGNEGIGPRADDVLAGLDEPRCLGRTLRGAPRHPLYVPGETAARRY